MASPNPDITFRNRSSYDSDTDVESGDATTVDTDSANSACSAVGELREYRRSVGKSRKPTDDQSSNRAAAGGLRSVVADVHAEDKITPGAASHGGPTPRRWPLEGRKRGAPSQQSRRNALVKLHSPDSSKKLPMGAVNVEGYTTCLSDLERIDESETGVKIRVRHAD